MPSSSVTIKAARDDAGGISANPYNGLDGPCGGPMELTRPVLASISTSSIRIQFDDRFKRPSGKRLGVDTDDGFRPESIVVQVHGQGALKALKFVGESPHVLRVAAVIPIDQPSRNKVRNRQCRASNGCLKASCSQDLSPGPQIVRLWCISRVSRAKGVQKRDYPSPADWCYDCQLEEVGQPTPILMFECWRRSDEGICDPSDLGRFSNDSAGVQRCKELCLKLRPGLCFGDM